MIYSIYLSIDALSSMIAEIKRLMTTATKETKLTKEIVYIKEERRLVTVAGQTGDYVNNMLDDFEKARDEEARVEEEEKSESRVETMPKHP